MQVRNRDHSLANKQTWPIVAAGHKGSGATIHKMTTASFALNRAAECYHRLGGKVWYLQLVFLCFWTFE